MSRTFRTARELAFEVVADTLIDDAYANLVMSQLTRQSSLSERDKALAVELSYGTLRRLNSIDEVLSQFLVSRKTLPEVIKIILRLGSYQLLFTRIPVHAALSETVNLCRYIRKPQFTKLVNAVLRRVSQHTFEEYADQLHRNNSFDTRLSFTSSHPEWIIRAFRQSREKQAEILGEKLDNAQLQLLCESNNIPAKVNLAQVLPLEENEQAELEKRASRNTYSSIGWQLNNHSPSSLSSVRSGKVRVQDEGSQLAALTLLAASPITAQENWADFCAGPGGKAAILAAASIKENTSLTLNEVSEHRAELVKNAISSIRPELEVLVHDGRALGKEFQGTFDRILLDAPCSGLGSLRRRPESRWRKQPSDLGALLKLQRELLESAIAALKPQGILAYVTCSPHYAETVQQVRWAVEEFGVQTLDTAAVLSEIVANPISHVKTEMNAVQLWPDLHNTDAMFISIIQKNDSIE